MSVNFTRKKLEVALIENKMRRPVCNGLNTCKLDQ